MSPRNKQLHDSLKVLYRQYADTLLFHGWHHISFVTRKALEFAEDLRVNKELIEAAALTHDLNYIADVTSDVDAGKSLRAEQHQKVGYNVEEIALIETTVHSASIQNRDENISDLAKALSDADSLFKVLPVGPMILTARFITETKTDLRKWADRILISEAQQEKLDKGIYFYTDAARKRYTAWAKLDLEWVKMVRDSLDDPDIQSFLQDCKKLGFI
jgi:uncharacterized protein